MKNSSTYSGNRGISKMLKLNFFITVLCVCFSLLSFGQSASRTTAQDSTSNLPKQYVRIGIGMHILDCPVLPKQLKEKLLTVKGVKDYKEDMFTQSVYFNIPEGALTKEQIVKIAMSCAFPAEAITVFIESKPFVN